jgi:hypothetical protein
VEDPTVRLALELGLDPLRLSWFGEPRKSPGNPTKAINALKFALQFRPTAAKGACHSRPAIVGQALLPVLTKRRQLFWFRGSCGSLLALHFLMPCFGLIWAVISPWKFSNGHRHTMPEPSDNEAAPRVQCRDAPGNREPPEGYQEHPGQAEEQVWGAGHCTRRWLLPSLRAPSA